MMIVYDRETHEILGHSSRVYDSGRWREATVAELFPRRDATRLEALYLHDDPRYLQHGVGHWRLRHDADGLVNGIEPVPVIDLSCTATDTDGDGVPDLPADGQAQTEIAAVLAGGAGVAVMFRTTRGALAQRTVTADANGRAAVNLKSCAETVTAVVTATAPGYRQGRLALEFIPAGG